MSELSLRGALLVSVGAVFGALVRWAASAYLPRSFPYATFFVNVVGSFLIALFLFGPFARGVLGEDARLLLAVGFLGSFTTMSAFAFEGALLVEARQWELALAHVVGQPFLCVGAALLGRALGNAWA